METTTEEWRDVKGYEELYKISNKGIVYNMKYKRLLTNTIHHGICVVGLIDHNKKQRMFTIHYLVAVNILENPDNFNIVIHKDGNKLNNVPENLQFIESRSKKEKKKEPEDLEGEVWKEVGGFDGMYKVSNLGRVKSYNLNKIGNILKPRTYSNYDSVVLTDKEGSFKKHMVHRLVAYAFIQNPDNLPQVNHLDGNKHNNLVENLEWCTQQQNAKHAYNVLYPDKNKGEGNAFSILTNKIVLEIFEMTESGEYRHWEIAEKYGIDRSTVTDIARGKSWSHITGKKLVKLDKIPITTETVKDVFELTVSKRYSVPEIARICNVSTSTVYNIKCGRSYSEITNKTRGKYQNGGNSTLAEFSS